MKFWLALVSNSEFEQLPQIAQFAEKVGFHGMTLADHLVMPTKWSSPYPYTEDGKIWWPETTPWLDPWITIAALGAVTQKLEFATNIYLAALRDPFTAAKSVSTAAVLTHDRVVCGISVGWLKEEYDLVGVDFASRGKRMDEMLAVMRALWSGKPVNHRGEFFRFDEAIMCPPPQQPIRIWSGGGSAPALRRAALNDGWLGLPMPFEQLQKVCETMFETRRKAGLARENFDICAPIIAPIDKAEKQKLEAIGVNHVSIVSPWLLSPWADVRWTDEGDDITQLDVKLKSIERFAEKVIAPLAKK